MMIPATCMVSSAINIRPPDQRHRLISPGTPIIVSQPHNDCILVREEATYHPASHGDQRDMQIPHAIRCNITSKDEPTLMQNHNQNQCLWLDHACRRLKDNPIHGLHRAASGPAPILDRTPTYCSSSAKSSQS